MHSGQNMKLKSETAAGIDLKRNVQNFVKLKCPEKLFLTFWWVLERKSPDNALLAYTKTYISKINYKPSNWILTTQHPII